MSSAIKIPKNKPPIKSMAIFSNGKRIVFVSNRDFNNEIYIMNADGSNQVRLTYDPADDRDPAWAPF